MKIAIIGYGKMGHIIEEVAKSRGHEIVAVIDKDNTADFAGRQFASADVAIEFSTPATAVDNILASWAQEVPVVSGTTGWQDRLEELQALCRKGEGTLLWSSNFSIGVNIFLEVNRRCAELLCGHHEYTPTLTETHHIHKLDHPSGTAVTIAETIIKENQETRQWIEVEEEGTEVHDGVLPVHAIRRGEVPGIHEVKWDSADDTLTLIHSAKSRRGFALGAVMAAEWLKGRRGYFTMRDFLQF